MQKRTAQQTKTFDVTIIIAEAGYRQTVTVQALDEWKARAVAQIAAYRLGNMPKMNGAHVDYEVAAR